MKAKLFIFMIIVLLIGGCAGSDPNLIAIYQPGDKEKSCSVLKAEIANIDKQIILRQSQKNQKNTKNVICGVTGFLVIIPWFFMDLKESEKAEINALQQRKDALFLIAAEKDCGF